METRTCRIFFALCLILSPLLSGETVISLGLESPTDQSQALATLDLDLEGAWGQARAELDFPVWIASGQARAVTGSPDSGAVLRSLWLITPVLRAGLLGDNAWLALARGRSMHSVFALSSRGGACASPVLVPDTQDSSSPGAEVLLGLALEKDLMLQIDLAGFEKSRYGIDRTMLAMALSLRLGIEAGTELGIRAGMLASTRPGSLQVHEVDSDWIGPPEPVDWRSIQILQAGFSWTAPAARGLVAAQVSACPDGLSGLDLSCLAALGQGGRNASPASLALWCAWRDSNFRTLESLRPPVSWEAGARLALRPADFMDLELAASWTGANADGLAGFFFDPAELLVREALGGCGELDLGVGLDWTQGGLALRLGLDRDKEGQADAGVSLSVSQNICPGKDMLIACTFRGGMVAHGIFLPGSVMDADAGAGVVLRIRDFRTSADASLEWADLAGGGALPGAGPLIKAKLEFETRLQAPRDPVSGSTTRARSGSGGLPQAFVGFRMGLGEGPGPAGICVPGLAARMEFRCWYRLEIP